MIILDENILDGQRLLLEGLGIAVRQVGLDVGRRGLKDEDIIVLLRHLRQPTLLSRDLGFYTPALRNQHYAIVVAAVGQYKMAGFARRFLRHPLFDTHAKRAGKVVRLAPAGISFWELRRQREILVGWESHR
ncbi:MAG: hypothetical protein AAB403_06245 [Planctomycetota bacterium]